jgi:hypothetical protein
MRYRPLAFALLFACAAASAQNVASVQSDLDEAKRRHDEGMVRVKEGVLKQFALREEKVRAATNNLAQLKALQTEREYFDERGDLPPWLPTSLAAERQKLASDLEGDYQQAIRTLTRAKMDKAVRIPKHSAISTREEHTGPIEVFAVARTTKHNIRINAYRGSVVIFNWEVNPKELRVHWPDGSPDKPQSGSTSTAPVKPLEPNVFYQIRWLIGPQGMTVYLNDRKVFSESRTLSVDKMRAKVVIHTEEDEVDVREFRVRRLVIDR